MQLFLFRRGFIIVICISSSFSCTLFFKLCNFRCAYFKSMMSRRNWPLISFIFLLSFQDLSLIFFIVTIHCTYHNNALTLPLLSSKVSILQYFCFLLSFDIYIRRHENKACYMKQSGQHVQFVGEIYLLISTYYSLL